VDAGMSRFTLLHFFQLVPVLLLSACASIPEATPDPAFAPIDPMDMAPDPVLAARTGSIYQAGHAMSLFQDVKAYRVGDLITVRLEENTAAQKQQDTNTKKNNTTDITNPTLFGKPFTANGDAVGRFALGSQNEFEGKAQSSQSNRLNGTITVMVTKVLPNGLLQVRGEKWLGINQGNEFVRVRGLVRPVDVDLNNSVSSTQIANAYVAYGSHGALNDTNQPSWLARFFTSFLFPF